jgi:hypothetical protein
MRVFAEIVLVSIGNIPFRSACVLKQSIPMWFTAFSLSSSVASADGFRQTFTCCVVVDAVRECELDPITKSQKDGINPIGMLKGAKESNTWVVYPL